MSLSIGTQTYLSKITEADSISLLDGIFSYHTILLNILLKLRKLNQFFKSLISDQFLGILLTSYGVQNRQKLDKFGFWRFLGAP